VSTLGNEVLAGLDDESGAPEEGLAPLPGAGPTTGLGGLAGRVFREMDRFCGLILVVTLIVTSAIEFVTVVMRVFTGSGLYWADSACEVGLAVMGFLGAVTSFIRNDHVGMAGLKEKLHNRARRELLGAIGTISFVIALVMAKEGLSMVSDHTLGKFPATGWPTVILYVPLAAGGVLLALTILFSFVRQGLREIPWLGVAITVVGIFLYELVVSNNPLGFQNSTAVIVTVVIILAAVLIGTPIAFSMLIGAIAGIVVQRLDLTQVALQMTNGVEGITLLALPMFIMVGVLYTQLGFSEVLAQVFRKAGRRVPAADGIAMVAAMFAFSGLSGSKLADVSAVGTAFTGGRLDAEQSAARGIDDVTRAETSGLVSASAVMGEVIAPSIAMLVLGSVTTVSTGALFAAGLLPAVVVGVAIVVVAILRRDKFPSAHAGADDASFWVLLVKSLPALIGVVVLALVVVTGAATATEASAVAAVYSLVLAAVYRMPFKRVLAALAIAARLSGMLLFTIAAAGVLSWFLTVSGLSTYVTDLSNKVGGHASLFMIAMIVILTIVGSAVEGLPAIILLSPLLIPQAQQLGIDPVQAGIVILLSMGMGIFLPPLGNGFYTSCTACGIAPGRALKATFIYMLPVVVGILVIAFVPVISTWLPGVFGLT
jgi:tripartite ATP-independent transporter DctM subunit